LGFVVAVFVRLAGVTVSLTGWWRKESAANQSRRVNAYWEERAGK